MLLAWLQAIPADGEEIRCLKAVRLRSRQRVDGPQRALPVCKSQEWQREKGTPLLAPVPGLQQDQEDS